MPDPNYETFEDQIEDVVQTMLQSWAEYSKDPEKHDQERFEQEMTIESEPMPLEESLRILRKPKKMPIAKKSVTKVPPVALSKEDQELLGNQ